MTAKVQYRVEDINIGPWSFKLKRVQNLDDLIDSISDEDFNEDERMPYWAELWPSALGLSAFLMNRPELIEGQTVLELGMGLGLTSLVLQKLRPRSLLLTDYEQSALDLTRQNFRLNALEVPDMQLLDWRRPNLKEKFYRIVASDILYEERFFTPLLDLFTNFLHPEGKIIIAEPNRGVAKTFFEKLRQRGFSWDAKTVIVPDKPKPIRVTNYVISKHFSRRPISRVF